ncbi:hypothetical protein [Cohaesibacter celericrescens]|uniref:hypothetical protein n=1 Tax=Cohaesibacter celericrescens TaxID=2067669 RepID=UPI003569F0B6
MIVLCGLSFSHALADGAVQQSYAGRTPAITVSTSTQDADRFGGDRSSAPLFKGPTLISSGFSGVGTPTSDSLQGAARVSEGFIDPHGVSVSLTAIDQMGAEYKGLEIKRRPYDGLQARDTGQIFGLAIDDADAANLYLAATSAYGLPIVGRDRDGDGHADKLYVGRPDAEFMPGLFGPNRGNGPGSVWKVDGRTGQVSLFATLTVDGVANSGPGLGNISFDAQSQQLFVSDLDTGMIFRLNMEGRVLETFDHGRTARGLAGLSPVVFDPSNRLDITSPSFDVENPDSWHFAAEGRRVWGLAAHNGRLYYAVAEGPEIWSVGIAPNDGAFLFDARKEYWLPASYPSFEISDIAFGPDGSMILAQRGERVGSYDFTRITKARRAETIRVLKRRDGTWRAKPQSYAIGFANQMRNGTGGVAIGPAYGADGRIDEDACNGVLWATGDHLRNRPQLATRLSRGGALEIAGVQVQPIGRYRDDNTPPWASSFHDFDGTYPDQSVDGQMGDVEVLGCAGLEVPVEPEVSVDQTVANLHIKKTSIGECLANRQNRSYSCDFLLTISNRGDKLFDGPLVITDQFAQPAPIDASVIRGEGWQCSKPKAGSFSCLHERLIIQPGKTVTVTTQMQLAGQTRDVRYNNCAMLGVGSTDRQQITVVQLSMKSRDIVSGGVDGLMGPNTRKGLRELEEQLGLAVTGEISPELFDALGTPMADTSGLSCAPVVLKSMALPPVYDVSPIEEEPAIIILPPDPVEAMGPTCDRATTVKRGNRCVCRYDRMRKASQTECACPRGTRFVKGQGCLERRQPPALRCDRRTSVAMDGRCECRFEFMHKTSPTACRCNPGGRFVRNQGCVQIRKPFIKPRLF